MKLHHSSPRSFAVKIPLAFFHHGGRCGIRTHDLWLRRIRGRTTSCGFARCSGLSSRLRRAGSAGHGPSRIDKAIRTPSARRAGMLELRMSVTGPLRAPNVRHRPSSSPALLLQPAGHSDSPLPGGTQEAVTVGRFRQMYRHGNARVGGRRQPPSGVGPV